MRRTYAVLFVVIAVSVGWMQCSTPPARPSAEALLAEACQFLWDAQGEDGGWHSETHGLLRGGQAWTTFVLHALLEAPHDACDRSEDDVERALAFIRNHVNEEGVVGLSDPDLLEYPNYATAYAVRVLARYGGEADRPLIDMMVRYLLGQQFVNPRGFGPGDPAYGSWGFGEQHLPPGRTGHVDLSHTRRVLQALRDAGVDTLATYGKAEAFLRLVQKHPLDPRLQAAGLDTLYDGGFYASPVVPGVNKSAAVAGAPPELPLFDSYATTTCDGLLALLAAGVSSDDERVLAAARWLRTHPALAYPEGIPQDHPAQWHRVLFYYHLAVRGEAYQALGETGDWADEMVQVLSEKQREDGSFSNPYGAPNKEDDPILATALVVQALGNALHGDISQ